MDLKINDEENEVQLISNPDEIIINQICAILKDNNIPYIKRYDGSGSYLNMSMGGSIQEKRIYVLNRDLDKAKELIEPFISNETGEVNYQEQDEEDESYKKYNLIRKIAVWYILSIPIFVILLVIVCSIFIR